MSRPIWKGPFVEKHLLKKLVKSAVKGKKRNTTIKTWSRSSTIIPQFVGKSVKIYNGRTFMPLNITEEMIGHKFGEFSLTRKRPQHKVKSNK